MRKKGWGLLYVGISSLEPFNDKYGFVAGDEVLRFTALLMGETIDQLGTSEDFIGHIGGDDFMIITPIDKVNQIADALAKRFGAEVGTHYDFKDRQAGVLTFNGKQYPFMSLAIGIVTSEGQQFSDIREITEVAADARRLAAQG
jgi:diguanylate cyclase (GGDEF)-like protein